MQLRYCVNNCKFLEFVILLVGEQYFRWKPHTLCSRKYQLKPAYVLPLSLSVCPSVCMSLCPFPIFVKNYLEIINCIYKVVLCHGFSPFGFNADSRLMLGLRGLPNSNTIGYIAMILCIMQRNV